jgi:HPt (histidine-containing phosphotransfer) domain-containing protein
MADWPATIRDAVMENAQAGSGDPPAFDAAEFDELSEVIGENGMREIVEIFATETRRRLRRLADGNQNLATQVREMHTLKGAAATVGAPRLTALGRTFEEAASDGIAFAADDLKVIEAELEAYLAAIRDR